MSITQAVRRSMFSVVVRRPNRICCFSTFPRTPLSSLMGSSTSMKVRSSANPRYQPRWASSSSSGGSSVSVFEFVRKQQADAIRFFSDLQNRAPEEGFKRVFKMILEDEVKHKEWVEKVLGVGPLGEIARSTMVREGQNVFQLLQAEGIDLLADVKEVEELYRSLRDIKQQSRDWYTDRAIEAREHKVKALYQTIADEEAVHVTNLENLLSFVAENEVNQNPRWSG